MEKVIPEIVSQHAEEAAFLWLLREGVTKAPHYNLKDLAEHDERVEAHIDGLRVAGEPGWEICKEQLSQEEPGEVFAASGLAFESGQQDWINLVLEVGSKSDQLARGVISALGWLSFEQASEHIQKLLSEESTILKRIGVAASSIHRQDAGEILKTALAHENLELRVRALKAVGELGRSDLLNDVRVHCHSEYISCRFSAAWTAARLGDAASIQVLQELAINSGSLAERASAMALRRMPIKEAHAWQRELASRPELHRLAVQAVGVIGDPVSMPWLIDQMAIPEVARVAGESFSMITGVDLAYDDLEGEWPEGFEAGPTEDPEDENVEMDADEDLPWPNFDLLHKWRDESKRNYQNGTRYLCGKPMTIESLKGVLKTGYQRQRIAAAIELAIRQPDTPLFETRAPGWRQQKCFD
ncbi:TIGR02270 family protein [Candidatus Nitrospira salsa]